MSIYCDLLRKFDLLNGNTCMCKCLQLYSIYLLPWKNNNKKIAELEICSSSYLPATTCNKLLENKWKIYDEVERCGFQYKVVAAFSHMTRVDDTFIKELVDEVKHVENLFAFAEAFEDKMVGKNLINRSGKKICALKKTN